MTRNLLITILLVLVSCHSFQEIQGQTFNNSSSGVMNSYLAENNVQLDGRWTTPIEWTDSVEIKMEPSPWDAFPGMAGTAYCRIKHDSNYIYVLVDAISDTTPGESKIQNYYTDFAGVFLYPEGHIEDAYAYCVSWHSGKTSYHFKATMKNQRFDWNYTQQTNGISSSSYDARYNLYSTRNHLIYEFKIPRTPVTEYRAFITCDDTNIRTHFAYPQFSWEESWGSINFNGRTYFDRRNEVKILLEGSNNGLERIYSEDLKSSSAQSKLQDAQFFYRKGLEAINLSDFSSVEEYAKLIKQLTNEISNTEKEYQNTCKIIDEARNLIANAREEGRTSELNKSEELLDQSETAFSIQDYNKSSSLANEAKLLAANSTIQELQNSDQKPNTGVLPASSYNNYILVAGVVTAALLLPILAIRQFRIRNIHRKQTTQARAPENYEEYLSNLTRLKESDRISKDTYHKLKKEYEEKTENSY